MLAPLTRVGGLLGHCQPPDGDHRRGAIWRHRLELRADGEVKAAVTGGKGQCYSVLLIQMPVYCPPELGKASEITAFIPSNFFLLV